MAYSKIPVFDTYFRSTLQLPYLRRWIFCEEQETTSEFDLKNLLVHSQNSVKQLSKALAVNLNYMPKFSFKVLVQQPSSSNCHMLSHYTESHIRSWLHMQICLGIFVNWYINDRPPIMGQAAFPKRQLP